MKNKYLENELLSIQREYKELLGAVCDKKDSDDFQYIIEEVGIFWYSKRSIVELILNYVSEDFDTFLFTGATYLDIEDGEHYPFVSLGKVHIVDDPLAKYADVIKMSPNTEFYQMLKKQIILALDDNMLVLEQCPEKVFLLPVTLMRKIDNDLVRNATQTAFLSMFEKEMTFQEVLAINSLEKVVKLLKGGIEKRIIFLDDENADDDILLRFTNYLAENDPFGDISSNHKFIYSIMGFLTQSIQILLSAAQYKMIPYIRYDVTYNYLTILSFNFLNVPHMDEILTKIIFGHLFYIRFNRGNTMKMEFEKFYYFVEELDIIGQLDDSLNSNYDLNSDNLKIIKDIANNVLKRINEKISDDI